MRQKNWPQQRKSTDPMCVGRAWKRMVPKWKALVDTKRFPQPAVFGAQRIRETENAKNCRFVNDVLHIRESGEDL